ncbi:uncharacterized protein LOC119406996 [Rhipicephalus sanguineus]|uniref:uncharacterized protein LOC119406996 n=1 Tax=Rhipicephalus sanguineus TaxID=34632 RepID=UPI0018935D4C|nr:uncharacterized protein LOC119406996 [Rhipicephalus sanguineus]
MEKWVLAAICFVTITHMKLQLRMLPEIYVVSVSIKGFVNTREVIWTYSTTKISEARCRYDVMRSIQEMFITFNRTVLYSGQRITTDLLRRFSRRREERMYIIRRGRTLSSETIFYKAPDSSCAVIVLKSMIQNRSWYGDLRVRNSSITKDLFPECERRFAQLARCGRVIYSPSCSQELRDTL